MTEAKIYPLGCPERTGYVSVCSDIKFNTFCCALISNSNHSILFWYQILYIFVLYWYQIVCISVFFPQYCVDDYDALGPSGSTKHVNNIQARNKNRIRRRWASSVGRVRIWQLCQENRSFEGRHDSTKRNDFVHWSIHWLDTCGNVWQRISQADVCHLIEFREGVPHICWFQESECTLISISN